MGSTVVVPIVLGVLGSGGLITAIAALRKGKIDGDNTTLATLNERLNDDNLLLRTEVTELRSETARLRSELSEMWLRVTVLERQLREALG